MFYSNPCFQTHICEIHVLCVDAYLNTLEYLHVVQHGFLSKEASMRMHELDLTRKVVFQIANQYNQALLSRAT